MEEISAIQYAKAGGDFMGGIVLELSTDGRRNRLRQWTEVTNGRSVCIAAQQWGKITGWKST